MNKKYRNLILFDIAMALLIVVLYSPGLLALSPFDAGVLRPGLAISCAIFIGAALVYANASALRSLPPASRAPRQIEAAKATPERAAAAIARFAADDVLGTVARSAGEQVGSAARKKTVLLAAIEAKFPKGSLSYDRFADTVDAAVSTVARNTAALANRMATFDTGDYRKISRLVASGEYRSDRIPDALQEEKAGLYAAAMQRMDATVAANERLLLELDKFAAELALLDAAAAEGRNDEILAEIGELIEQTKYYE